MRMPISRMNTAADARKSFIKLNTETEMKEVKERGRPEEG